MYKHIAEKDFSVYHLNLAIKRLLLFVENVCKSRKKVASLHSISEDRTLNYIVLKEIMQIMLLIVLIALAILTRIQEHLYNVLLKPWYVYVYICIHRLCIFRSVTDENC